MHPARLCTAMPRPHHRASINSNVHIRPGPRSTAPRLPAQSPESCAPDIHGTQSLCSLLVAFVSRWSYVRPAGCPSPGLGYIGPPEVALGKLHSGLWPHQLWRIGSLARFLWVFDGPPAEASSASTTYAQQEFAGFEKAVTLSLTAVQEERLGFGISLAPNVAQRAGCAILAVFRRRFDAEEKIIFDGLLDPVSQKCTPYSALDALSMRADGWTDVCRWIHSCRHPIRGRGTGQSLLAVPDTSWRHDRIRPAPYGHSRACGACGGCPAHLRTRIPRECSTEKQNRLETLDRIHTLRGR
jgi:hypothetical protein